MKKYLALLLSVMLLAGCLTGCGGEVTPVSDDTVMVVSGVGISWDQFMYYLNYATNTLVSYYQNSTGGGVDWDGTCMFDRSLTNTEWCVKEAKYMAAEGAMIMAKAKEAGVEPTDEQIEELKASIENYKENFASEDDPEQAFIDALRYQGYTPDSVIENGKINYAFNNLFNKLYGENGENVSDEAFEKFVEDNGYMRSAHILFTFTETVTDEDGKQTEQERSDEKKAELKAQLEEIAAELQAMTDDNARAERFFELMNELSEDPGKVSNPDGYCFTDGTMVESYTNTTKALKPYEVSGVVESNYGYHVIMTLPVQRTDIDVSSQTGYTLGRMAGSYAFDDEITAWKVSDSAVFTDSYKDFDFTQFFSKASGFTLTTYAEFTAANQPKPEE